MHLVGIFLESFQSKIRYVEMDFSRTVSEQTVLWNNPRKDLNACSRIVLEQTIRIFLKLSYSQSTYLLEKYWDTYRMLYVTFYGGGVGVGHGRCSTIFQERSSSLKFCRTNP